MKICFKCNTNKPLTEFYVHKRMKDGYFNKCKTCTKKDVLLHREENIEKIREYDRKRSKLTHRIARASEYNNWYRKEYPKRAKCVAALNRAVRGGKIFKIPCWVCGERKVEAHHPDYDAPLAVVWLCAVHHKEIHLKHKD